MIALVFVTRLVKLANLSQATTGVIVIASVAYFATLLTNPQVTTVE